MNKKFGKIDVYRDGGSIGIKFICGNDSFEIIFKIMKTYESEKTYYSPLIYEPDFNGEVKYNLLWEDARSLFNEIDVPEKGLERLNYFKMGLIIEKGGFYEG